MRILDGESGWSLALTFKDEARALLEAQATPVGNRAMSSTDPGYDRVEPGRSAVELLRFAELVLPSDEQVGGGETVAFPQPEAQHLSSLMYGALRFARETGSPTTQHDDLLAEMNAQVDAFFGMDV